MKQIGAMRHREVIRMFKEKIKKLDALDITLIKLGSMAFILFLIIVWPSAMEIVHGIHWGWFLGALIVFSIRPWK